MDIVTLHERALDATGGIVATVRRDQLAKPTPCTDWNVRALVNHLIGGNFLFASAAEGEAVDTARDAPDFIGADPLDSYNQSVKALTEAWRRPGVLEAIVHLPFGDMPGQFALGMHFVDSLVHGWDLARAIGSRAVLDPDLAAAAHRIAAGVVSDDLRGPGRPFGPQVKVPDDASVADRLVAFLGREP